MCAVLLPLLPRARESCTRTCDSCISCCVCRVSSSMLRPMRGALLAADMQPARRQQDDKRKDRMHA